MSDLQGRRIPGEENSGRKRPILWIVLGLVLLLLLAVLIPFACQAVGGGSGQGSGDGSGAQGGAERGAEEKDGSDNAGNAASGNAASGNAASGNAASGNAASGNADQGGGDQGGGDQRAGGSGGSQEEVAVTAVTRLSARDQGGDGAAVTVPEADVEGAGGWLAVRADDGGKPGEVLGYAPLEEGENRRVEVGLRRSLVSSQKVYATVHAERPADGDFTYPDGDPTARAGGGTAVEPISYTLSDASGDVAEDETPDGELPETGGVPPPLRLAAGAGGR